MKRYTPFCIYSADVVPLPTHTEQLILEAERQRGRFRCNEWKRILLHVRYFIFFGNEEDRGRCVLDISAFLFGVHAI